MAADNSQDIGVHQAVTSPGCYKRKSAKTVARDKQRLKRWRSKSIGNQESSGVTTRSQSIAKESTVSAKHEMSSNNDIDSSDDGIESPRFDAAERSMYDIKPTELTPIMIERNRSESASSFVHDLKLDNIIKDRTVFNESDSQDEIAVDSIPSRGVHSHVFLH